MDKAMLQRLLMTAGALLTVALVKRFLPESSDAVTGLARDALMLAGGGLLGAAHVSKPGETKAEA